MSCLPQSANPLTYSLYVRQVSRTGDVLSLETREEIEALLTCHFGAFLRLVCGAASGCVIYAVDAVERTEVFDVARKIAGIARQECAWVGLPSGRLTVLPVALTVKP